MDLKVDLFEIFWLNWFGPTNSHELIINPEKKFGFHFDEIFEFKSILHIWQIHTSSCNTNSVNTHILANLF